MFRRWFDTRPSRADLAAAGLLLLSGISQAALTPPWSVVAIHPIAFVPALLALRQSRGAQAFRRGWLWGAATMLSVFWWVIHTITVFSNLPDVAAVAILLLFAGAFGLYLGVFGWAWAAVRDRLGPWRLLGGAALFTAAEFLNPQLFPYFQGSVWYQEWWFFLGAAALGVPFLTFQVFLWNLVAAETIGLHLDHGRPGFDSLLRRRAVGVGAGVAALLLLGTVGYSIRREAAITEAETKAETIRLALVQTNQTVFTQRAMLERSRTATLDDNLELSLQALTEHGPIDVLVWPEGAVKGTPLAKLNWRLAAFVKEHGVEVWTGGSSAKKDVDGRALLFNSAFRVHGEGEVGPRYDKMVLLPFGEFMPLRDLLPVLKRIRGPGNFHRGEVPVVYERDGLRFVFLICYEAIQSGHVRELVNLGADLLVNITYDAWFGDTTCPHQHLMLSAIQAAQYGRPLVRSATTGISAFVDARGQIVEQSGVFTREVRVRDVAKVRIDALYARIGDMFAWLCVAVSLVLILRSRRPA